MNDSTDRTDPVVAVAGALIEAYSGDRPPDIRGRAERHRRAASAAIAAYHGALETAGYVPKVPKLIVDAGIKALSREPTDEETAWAQREAKRLGLMDEEKP